MRDSPQAEPSPGRFPLVVVAARCESRGWGALGRTRASIQTTVRRSLRPLCMGNMTQDDAMGKRGEAVQAHRWSSRSPTPCSAPRSPTSPAAAQPAAPIRRRGGRSGFRQDSYSRDAPEDRLQRVGGGSLSEKRSRTIAGVTGMYACAWPPFAPPATAPAPAWSRFHTSALRITGPRRHGRNQAQTHATKAPHPRLSVHGGRRGAGLTRTSGTSAGLR